jgi:hypothetical protein
LKLFKKYVTPVATEVFPIVKVGNTRDIKPDLSKGATPRTLTPELDARVKAWFDTIKSKTLNGIIPKVDVDGYFQQNPNDNLDEVKNVVSELGAMFPMGYVVPAVASEPPEAAQTSIPTSPASEPTPTTSPRVTRRNTFDPRLASNATPEQRENARWFQLSIKKTRTPEEDEEFRKLSAKRPASGGKGMRKKKLRTRRGGKQKNNVR